MEICSYRSWRGIDPPVMTKLWNCKILSLTVLAQQCEALGSRAPHCEDIMHYTSIHPHLHDVNHTRGTKPWTTYLWPEGGSSWAGRAWRSAARGGRGRRGTCRNCGAHGRTAHTTHRSYRASSCTDLQEHWRITPQLHSSRGEEIFSPPYTHN